MSSIQRAGGPVSAPGTFARVDASQSVSAPGKDAQGYPGAAVYLTREEIAWLRKAARFCEDNGAMPSVSLRSKLIGAARRCGL